MTMPDFTFAQPIALASEGGSAPDWIQLFPAGPEIVARDGRRFRMDDPQAVLAAFEAYNAPLPIDVEHASSIRSDAGLDAPAYGWINKLEIRAGEIWGQVEWTAQAREWIENRNYRFISPGFAFVKATGAITRLLHAGLVNRPAFEMQALARESASEETDMDPTVLEALGLQAGATAAQAVAAIGALKEKVATAKAADPDPAKFVPMAQLEAANARVSELEAEKAGAEKEAIASAVDDAVEAGKIAPASRGHYVRTAEALGLAAFREMVATMPVIAGGSGMKADDDKKKGGAAGLTEDELAVCKMMGTDPEAFAAAKAEEAK